MTHLLARVGDAAGVQLVAAVQRDNGFLADIRLRQTDRRRESQSNIREQEAQKSRDRVTPSGERGEKYCKIEELCEYCEEARVSGG